MKEYSLDVDVRILDLLGPSLYTNIYYVLAELIANAYDADANNVYVIVDDNRIVVEDDGRGMSYNKGEVQKFLKVAAVSRLGADDSRTRLNRLKMGRKGIGKLAALSVSEKVIVKTISNGELSGFVMLRHPENKSLQALDDDDISFEKISGSGTSIEMINPQYKLHKTESAIKRNLMRIFPAISDDFCIHIFVNNKELIINSVDKEIGADLCACILLGDKSKNIKTSFRTEFPDRDLLVEYPEKILSIDMTNNQGEQKKYDLKIEGWIGVYKTTRGRKRDFSDFPDNFISLYANDKMGEFNILPSVGANKLNESYVVGQLHIDLFELSELPDMALSNRQGYKSDDPRYLSVIEYVRSELLPEILRKRVEYSKAKKAAKDKESVAKQEENEILLKKKVEKFKRDTSIQVAKEIVKKESNLSEKEIVSAVEKAINDNSNLLELKKQVDQQKKKIFISHTRKDKDVCDIVYQMLIFNNVPAEDIIYTSCDDEICRIPQGMSIYDYLRRFFVDSISDKKMYMLFVTSKNTSSSWGAMVEIGAAWITQVSHKIFNVEGFRPSHPLDDESAWNTIQRNADNQMLSISSIDADDFCSKIEQVCQKLGYSMKNRADNNRYLNGLIEIKDC